MSKLTRTMIARAINECVLNERNRGILRWRMLDGLTYERIAEMTDLSVQRVKQIVYTEKPGIEEYAQKLAER